ncbi:MAG: AbrB/MazE/SpoVT family DNA-binding domain-containing protein [Clostridia bacterium]|nr:AbrB/MazE/SpoVT family DNA-binding domain-containing protein [Clostridia bacterium]
MNMPAGKYAWTATVGEKGQIVIPKQARELFGIRPGDTLLLLGDEKRGIAIVQKESFTALYEAVFGGDES